VTSASAAAPTGDIAQLGERRLCKPEAAGSSPAISTRHERRLRRPVHRRRAYIDLGELEVRFIDRIPSSHAALARRARSLTIEYETLGKYSQSTLVIFSGQATKGAWWMPWHEKAMKDVVSCDKPR
jgi:hypothetical protein